MLTLSIALAGLLGVAGCADDSSDRERLPARTASELRSNLDTIEQQVDAGDCTGAGTQAETMAQNASELPQRVDDELQEALLAGVERLQELIDERCEPAAGTTGPTTEQPPPVEEEETDEDQQEQEKPNKPKKENGKGPEGEGPPGQTDKDQGTDGEDGVLEDESGGSAP